jgi:hypothetical protein
LTACNTADVACAIAAMATLQYNLKSQDLGQCKLRSLINSTARRDEFWLVDEPASAALHMNHHPSYENWFVKPSSRPDMQQSSTGRPSLEAGGYASVNLLTHLTSNTLPHGERKRQITFSLVPTQTSFKLATASVSIQQPSTVQRHRLHTGGIPDRGGDLTLVKPELELQPPHVYTITKCYLGFCTQRRTEMELEKKPHPRSSVCSAI